jgi:hypothetical protein
VLLLENDPALGATALIDGLTAASTYADEQYAGHAAAFVGDPASALLAAPEPQQRELAKTLDEVIARLFPGRRFGVDARSYRQCLCYMAWHQRLAADSNSTITALAAENAILHFILPVRSASEFKDLLDRFATKTLPLESEAQSPDVPGGLLHPRLERLRAARSGPLDELQAIDFWESLS